MRNWHRNITNRNKIAWSLPPWGGTLLYPERLRDWNQLLIELYLWNVCEILIVEFIVIRIFGLRETERDILGVRSIMSSNYSMIIKFQLTNWILAILFVGFMPHKSKDFLILKWSQRCLMYSEADKYAVLVIRKFKCCLGYYSCHWQKRGKISANL